MSIVSRRYLAISVIAACGAPLTAFACPTCSNVGGLSSDVSGYASEVTSGYQNAADTTNQTIENVTVGFTSSATQISQNGQEVVAAIQANAQQVGLELEMTREAQLRLLDSLKNSLGALEQSAMVARANKEIAETYGPENVPAILCNAWGRLEAREQAQAVAEEILKDHREKQLADRADEFRVPVGDAFLTDLVSINSSEFSEGQAEIALEQIGMITGERSFPVSPDVIALQALEPGSGTQDKQQVMSAWLRTANASADVAAQVAKRVKPTVEGENGPQMGEVSEMSDLWSAVSEGVSADAAIEDATATDAALLRTIARSQRVSNKIRYEQLEATLARVRMSASQLGYMNEDAMRKLSDYFDRSQSTSRGGSGG